MASSSSKVLFRIGGCGINVAPYAPPWRRSSSASVKCPVGPRCCPQSKPTCRSSDRGGTVLLGERRVFRSSPHPRATPVGPSRPLRSPSAANVPIIARHRTGNGPSGEPHLGSNPADWCWGSARCMSPTDDIRAASALRRSTSRSTPNFAMCQPIDGRRGPAPRAAVRCRPGRSVRSRSLGGHPGPRVLPDAEQALRLVGSDAWQPCRSHASEASDCKTQVQDATMAPTRSNKAQ